MPQEAINLLLGIIYAETQHTRLTAANVEQLQMFQPSEVLRLLRALYAKESDRGVRSRIYQSILALKDIDTVGCLIEMLKEPPEEMHVAYCHDLAEFDDPRARSVLVQVLLESADPTLRCIVAELLGSFDTPEVIKALEYIRDHDFEADFQEILVSDAATWALEQIYNRRK